MSQNNVLFILTDQLRWDGIGKVGGWVKTPNIDKIASEGMLFTNCVTNSPVCIPARLSLATGLYPHTTGVWKNMSHTLPENSNTWMNVIRESGYETSIFGKSHLHSCKEDLRGQEYYMNAYGFETVNEIGGPRASMSLKSHMTGEWEKKGIWQAYIDDYRHRFNTKPYVAKPSVLPLEDYADVYVGRKAKEYLDNYKEQKPWFCMVSFGGPHEPWDAPEPYASMYLPEDMPKPITKIHHRNHARPQGHLDLLLEEKDYHAPDMMEQEILEMRANYAGNVTLIDDQIGEILEVLKRRDMLDNTIIVFTSDHGEMNGDHGLIYKEQFLEGAVRVPLIIQTPEIKGSGGRVYEGPVELFDIGPTLVELVGAALSYPQEAKSLLPVLKNPILNHRDFALCEVHDEVMIRNREWKLAMNSNKEPYLLINLIDDPEEQHNLIGDAEYSKTLNSLSDILLRKIRGE